MQSSRITPSASSARRFLLLPEDSLEAGSRRPRIRRYQLAAVSPRGGRPPGRAAAAHVRGDDAAGRI
ncbi:MAG TPA: hypothetical protein VGX51_12300 [Solirubrobacteraceae bacterium]|jgi:hypothetical protein|nr:hypothetical protein [Solirubrobacteraceae bacterium]